MRTKSATTKELLDQAKDWGFVVGETPQGSLQIGCSASVLWRLEHRQLQNQWILVVRNVPQIRFSSTEAISFLARLDLVSGRLSQQSEKVA
ncbi:MULTISPECIES: hypothetical protein [Leptolyngbya]|uniref:hypothetical protein n=1 Tax=Leptolyngbya TaxID=47251 RepID=UPI001685E517|nr:hypothetical protein [Leptolyngbya sp. FACHB-1624]MBD1854550.1 hypothetical protein [Leptolyngbya sp. FACHB-1624]